MAFIKTKDEEKKEQIIGLLKQDPKEWFNLTNIASNLGIHYNKAESLIKDLFYENKVEKEERGYYTFWRIKQ